MSKNIFNLIYEKYGDTFFFNNGFQSNIIYKGFKVFTEKQIRQFFNLSGKNVYNTKNCIENFLEKNVDYFKLNSKEIKEIKNVINDNNLISNFCSQLILYSESFLFKFILFKGCDENELIEEKYKVIVNNIENEEYEELLKVKNQIKINANSCNNLENDIKIKEIVDNVDENISYISENLNNTIKYSNDLIDKVYISLNLCKLYDIKSSTAKCLIQDAITKNTDINQEIYDYLVTSKNIENNRYRLIIKNIIADLSLKFLNSDYQQAYYFLNKEIKKQYGLNISKMISSSSKKIGYLDIIESEDLLEESIDILKHMYNDFNLQNAK